MTDLEVLESEIVEVHTGRTSRNGTPYCSLELPSGDWVFVWEGHWKDEIEDNAGDYRGLDARIFVRDKEDDPDDHFYNLVAVVPRDREEALQFFKRNRRQSRAVTG